MASSHSSSERTHTTPLPPLPACLRRTITPIAHIPIHPSPIHPVCPIHPIPVHAIHPIHILKLVGLRKLRFVLLLLFQPRLGLHGLDHLGEIINHNVQPLLDDVAHRHRTDRFEIEVKSGRDGVVVECLPGDWGGFEYCIRGEGPFCLLYAVSLLV